MTTQEEKKELHHYYPACCGPWARRSRGGANFCGTALVVLGGVWLAANLGLITADWWLIALPLLVVLWGVRVLLSGRRGAGQEPPEQH